MSVTKLMSRIVAPSDSLLDRCRDATTTDLISTLHDHTYGITSDPLTQFACVFSALIHDVSAAMTSKRDVHFSRNTHHTSTVLSFRLITLVFQMLSWSKKIKTLPFSTKGKVLPSKIRLTLPGIYS